MSSDRYLEAVARLRTRALTMPDELAELRAEQERLLAYHTSGTIKFAVGSAVIAVFLAALAGFSAGGWGIAVGVGFLLLSLYLLMQRYPRATDAGVAEYRLRQLTPLDATEHEAMEWFASRYPSLAPVIRQWQASGATLVYRDYEAVLWATSQVHAGSPPPVAPGSPGNVSTSWAAKSPALSQQVRYPQGRS